MSAQQRCCAQILCPLPATVEITLDIPRYSELEDDTYRSCDRHVEELAWGDPIKSVRVLEAGTTQPVPLLNVTPVPVGYRPSKWSTPWILLLGLIGYELWAVATSKDGGPLSHLVWWAYGDRWSIRWWLASMSLNGLGVWAAAHFMFERWEVRELGICVAVGLALGVVGWLVTR